MGRAQDGRINHDVRSTIALSVEGKIGIYDAVEVRCRANELHIERAAARFIVSTEPTSAGKAVCNAST